MFGCCFLKLFLRTVYENIENVIKMLSENSLLFKFNVFLCFSKKKQIVNQTYFPYFSYF